MGDGLVLRCHLGPTRIDFKGPATPSGSSIKKTPEAVRNDPRGSQGIQGLCTEVVQIFLTCWTVLVHLDYPGFDREARRLHMEPAEILATDPRTSWSTLATATRRREASPFRAMGSNLPHC